VAKSHGATPFGSKDRSSNTLHFKAIFDSPLKNVVRTAPVPGGGCATKSYPQKLHPRCHPHLTARHVAKFNKATPPGSKVLAANTLHFKPIFHQFLKKNVKEAPVPDEECASKNWSFSSTCKNLGAQHPLGAKIWPSEKFDLGG